MRGRATILIVLLVTMFEAEAFARLGIQSQRRSAALRSKTTLSMAGASEATKATLTADTTWRLRLLLNDVTTTNGRKLEGQLFVVEGSFIEEEGYEPPQGLFQETKNRSTAEQEEEDAEGSGGTSLEVSNSRWKLSEDPDDPKDGLWIWGLFKEPLYPFMLLQMETKELTLPASTDGENSDSIPPLKLYAQLNHIRNKDEGTVQLQSANLNIRVLELIKLPGASVEVFEEEAVGQISFQPL